MNASGGGEAGPDHARAGAEATRRLLGRGSIYTFGTALEAGSLLIAIPAVTRLLGPAGFGEVATALVVAAVVGLVAPLGITTAITRLYFDGDEGPEHTRALLIWGPLIALGIALVLDLTGPLWAPAITDLDYDAPLRLAVWSGPVVAAMLGAQAALIAQDRPGTFISVSLVSTVGAQVAAIVLLAAFDTGPTGYMAGFVGARAAAAVLGVASVGVRFDLIRDTSLLRRALALGLPTVSHAVAMYLLNAGDRLIVGRIEGLAAVGRYQVAYVIGSLGIILLFSLAQAWGPLIYGAPEDRRWSMLAGTGASVYRLAALVVSLIAVLAPIALAIAAPPEYDLEDLLPICAIVALAAIPLVTYLRCAIVLFQRKRTLALLWAAPVAMVVNFALNFALVPSFGLVGAAFATLGAYFLLGEQLRFFARRLADVPWRHASELAAWALAGSLVAVSAAVPGTGVWLGLRIAGGIVLALLLARAVRHSFLIERPAPAQAG